MNKRGKPDVDIENDSGIAFKEREKKSKRQRKRDEDKDGEMTKEELELLAKFDQGDKEIDDMLQVVIDKLDSLHLKSQNIGTQLS